MKIFGWHLDHGEHRATDHSQAVAEALHAAALTPQVNTGALGVVEACVGLISDPFLVATTSGATFAYKNALSGLTGPAAAWQFGMGCGDFHRLISAEKGRTLGSQRGIA